MMITCPNCNTPNEEGHSFCQNCGCSIEPSANANHSHAEWSDDSNRLSWKDISGLLGFISSITGCFWCAVFLLPLGLIASLVGVTGKRLRGIAISGLIIALLGGVIWVCTSGILPDWMINGVF